MRSGYAAQLIPMLRFAGVLCALLVATPDPSYAQNPFSEFFDGIFGGGGRSQNAGRRFRERSPAPRERWNGGGGREYYREPPARDEDYRESAQSQGRRYTPHSASRPQTISRPAAAHVMHSQHAAPESAKAAKKPPGTENFFVAVIGDTLAQRLAAGLDEALESTPQIGVLHKGKEDSGLVRDDFYDWGKAAREIAAQTPPPNVALLMVGSNDRQPLMDGAQSVEPLTPRWRELYAARVEAVASAFKEKNIPFIIVGLPVMKSERFSADMAQMNGVYRDVAAKTGAIYVDIWDKFADEHGQYSAFGPDMNGEIVKLRAQDGVHFTDSGARKLAHFVEGEIKRVFEARERPAVAQPAKPTSEAPQEAPPPAPPPAPTVFRVPGVEPMRVAPSLPKERAAVGPLQPLTRTRSEAEELARRRPPGEDDGSAQRALAQHVFVEGGDQPARPGRADDFARSAKTVP